MITPADIQNKDFTRKVRGYDSEEVDVFLDLITVDLEKLIKENLKLKAQLANMEKNVGSIGGTDLTVKDTLETAKSIMDDLAVSSEKRAKNLIENAEMDAAIIIKDAKLQAEKLADNSRELKNMYEKFRRDYSSMLDRMLMEFNNMNQDIEIDRLSTLIEKEQVVEKEHSILEDTVFLSKSVEDIIYENNGDEKSEDDDNMDMKKTMVNIKYE